MNQKGFTPILILLLVLVVGVSTVVVVNIAGNKQKGASQETKTSETTQSPTPSPSEQPSATPEPSVIPITSNTTTYSTSKITKTITGTTKTGWTITGSGEVDVIPYTRSDKHALFLDFEATTFSNITSIYYNLNYDTDNDATLRGGQGTLYPVSNKPSGTDASTGKLYIRREVVFGTCSNGVCNYETNPRNFRLTVTTTDTSGAKTTSTLSLSKLP